MSSDPPPPHRVHETSPPTMEVVCPHCGVVLSVSTSQAGDVISCSKCEGKFQAPLPTAAGPHSDPFRSQNANPDVREFASNKIAAGVCGILLGGLGVHKFILGLNTPAIIMLAVWLTGLITGMCIIIPLLACIAMQTIGLVEGIIYLTKTDEEFYRLYAIEKKEWF